MKLKKEIVTELLAGATPETLASKIAARDKIWTEALRLVRTSPAVSSASTNATGLLTQSDEAVLPLEALLFQMCGLQMHDAYKAQYTDKTPSERNLTANVDAWIQDYQTRVAGPWTELLETLNKADALVKKINSTLPEVSKRGNQLANEAITVASARVTRMRYKLWPAYVQKHVDTERAALDRCGELEKSLRACETTLAVVEDKQRQLVKAVTNAKAARKTLRLLQAQEEDETLNRIQLEAVKKKVILLH